MNIKYRILSIDEKEHAFIVRYYTDILTEDYLTAFYEDDGSIKRGPDGTPSRCRSDYNLTIFNVNATAEDVENLIKQSAPVEWFAMLEHVKQNEMTPALHSLKSKLDKEHEFEHKPPPRFPDGPTGVTEANVDDLIAKLTSNV